MRIKKKKKFVSGPIPENENAEPAKSFIKFLSTLSMVFID